MYMKKRNAMRLMLVALFTGVILGGLLGCNTLAGVGKDIGDTARWISDHHDNGWKRLEDRSR